MTSEYQRFEATEDTFVKILNDRSLDSVALDAHFSADDAKLAGEALKALFNRDGLEAGLCRRHARFQAEPRDDDDVADAGFDLRQECLCRHADAQRRGRLRVGCRPLGARGSVQLFRCRTEGGHKRQYRLLDAIYSTAARNNVPTGVIGEAIMYLSRGQDLDAFASEDQRLVLIYSQTPRGKDETSGRVLYVGVQGGEKTLDCFVFQQSDGQFACVTGDDQVRSLTVANGMVTPVNGRHDLDLRPAQASDPRRRSHPQGRRLGSTGRARRSRPPSTARSASRAMAAAMAIW